MTELHQKYAPILHFNQGEHFLPMRVDDLLSYSSLYVKGRDEPLVGRGDVTPGDLMEHRHSPDVFLRSVEAGPLSGADIAATWGEGTLEMVYRWAAETTISWTEELLRKAYGWFNPKTKKATQMFWWHHLIVGAVSGTLESVSSEKLPRLTLPAEIHDNAVEQYELSRKKSPGYTYYYRQVIDGSFLCLQYWFFYGYNDWGLSFAGLNDHEGDWESMYLFFRLDPQGRPQEPPTHITFANHESCQTKVWTDEDVTLVGTHPVSYSGAGSHATYPKATTYPLLERYGLFDYAQGDGVTIDHDEWAHRLNLDEVPWLAKYQGSWGTRYWLSDSTAKSLLQMALTVTPLSGIIGLTVPNEIELPGVSAPRGPVGNHRLQTVRPVEWAGVLET